MAQPFEVNGYRLIRHLGRGGTADVALAFVDHLNHEAAVKYPLNETDDPSIDFRKLARREYHLIGRSRFPGLVRLLDEPHSDPDFLTMEVCPGPTLDQIGRVENPAVAMNLISAVALDLEFLRVKKIIHGDLKPQNVFLPTDWRESSLSPLFFAKISDFSLGRFDDEQEESRAGLGTVGYMPPETIRDGRTSFQSDLFALGMIAYQILTGQHPFSEGETDPAVINSKIQEDDPVPIENYRNDLAPDLVKLILQLLSRDPDNRPETGLQVCEELARCGATYDFQRALHPKFLLDNSEGYEANTLSYLQLDEATLARLARMTCRSTTGLRVVMTANHARRNLVYSRDGFTFANGPIWPARMRNDIIRQFCRLPLATKKAAIKAAVVGDQQICLNLHLVEAESLPNHIEATIDLLRPMLHSSTVRCLSARFGPLTEQAEQQGFATSLYLQAGMLEEAERCALQYATVLIKDNANDDALRCIRSVVDFASMKGDLFKVRELLMVRGDLYKNLGETEKALQTYENLIAVYEGHDPDKILAETHKDLGDVYRKREDFANGLKALDRALKIYTDLGDQLEISHTLNNVGNLHSLNGDIRKALHTYRQAFAIQRRLDAKQEAASTLMNMGVIYYSTGRYRRCIRLTEISLKMKREIGNLAEIALSLNNLGWVHHVIGEQAKAVEYLHDSLEVNRKVGNRKEILYNLENLTEVMISAGQLIRSVPLLKEGMEIAEALNDRHHSGAFRILTAIVYFRTGRISDAESMLDQAQELIRDLDNHQLTRFLRLQRAYIRYVLGDPDTAVEEAVALVDLARQSQDIKSQVGALMLLRRLTDETADVDRLNRMIEEQHLELEKIVVRYARIEYLLGLNRIDEAVKLNSEEKILPTDLTDNIEGPWMCNLAAEILIHQNRFEEASRLLERSIRAARSIGLKSEWAVALTLLGRTKIHSGNYETSFRLYKEALELWKAIAGTINSEDDRLIFLKRRSIVFLTNEIRRLSSIFAQKKGQTNACPSHEV